ncbi:MAG: DNA gyrase subunit B, partial [Rhodobiaceae bacterium]|nr:DNA gyrase subunit B [Rhodobiaceae bacterium]
LYIAQPPLFKVKRGQSEQYLKDEHAMEDYLVDGGLDSASLVLADGETRTGADLHAVVESALRVRSLIDGLHSRYNRTVVEQAAIAGALNVERVADRDHAETAAAYVARRLDRIAEEWEKGWEGEVREDGAFVFSRTVRGVREAHVLDTNLIGSVDARRIDEHAAGLQEIYEKPAVLHRKDTETEVFGPSDLLDAVFSAGRKGISVQRYKGLGEMNAEQLWETTLDPNARTLLQVKVNEIDEAESIFSRLMGDVVEPRREFIQDNALSVANLDV